MNEHNFKLVCLGDSLTYGFGVPRQHTWPTLVAKRTGMEVINAGITGDTTGGMLARFDSDVVARSPQAVLLMGGCNDIFFSGSSMQARSNMSAMAHQAIARSIMPFIGIPILAAHRRCAWQELCHPCAEQAMADYVQWLFDFCRVFQITVVDFQRDFAYAMVHCAQPLHLPDGQHASAQGHRVMARTADCVFSELYGRWAAVGS